MPLAADCPLCQPADWTACHPYACRSSPICTCLTQTTCQMMKLMVSSYSRAAELYCELGHRLQQAQLTPQQPLTQRLTFPLAGTLHVCGTAPACSATQQQQGSLPRHLVFRMPEHDSVLACSASFSAGAVSAPCTRSAGRNPEGAGPVREFACIMMVLLWLCG